MTSRTLRCKLPALVAVLVLLPAFAASAQDVDPTREEQVKAMERFANFTGVWEGSGWMTFGDRKFEFQSREDFISAAGGLAVMVHGLHTVAIPGAEPRVVHDAAGLLTYDAKNGRYRFVTQLATGRGGDYSGQFDNEGRFSWEIPQGPGGTITYVISVSENEYTEVGYRQEPNGGERQQFFEMKLKKVSPADKH